MTAWSLPTSLTVRGVGYPIRTDFRDILYLLGILADPAFEEDERGEICLRVMYITWEDIPPEDRQEALDRAAAFIDGGVPAKGGRRGPRTMDWEQDGPIILPAVNRVLGREVREMEYLHWWTFLGAYMEIGESLFSEVLHIRRKRAKGKKLEKHEQEFYRENRELVELRPRRTEEEQARREALRALFV